jgi:hypothetical protein
MDHTVAQTGQLIGRRSDRSVTTQWPLSVCDILYFTSNHIERKILVG